MKLITFSVVVNDFRDYRTDDEAVDRLLEEVRHKIKFGIVAVEDKFDVALVVEED